MTKFNRRRAGYSLLEMIIVLALLLLFGVTTVSLIVSGSKAYKTLTAKMEVNSELRVAASYVNMRVRQNDAGGLIRLEKNPVSGSGNAIVITERAGTAVYETWIYFDAGILREGYVAAGERVTNDVSFTIADVDGFDIDFAPGGKALRFNVWRGEGAERQTREMTLAIRTDRQAGS